MSKGSITSDILRFIDSNSCQSDKALGEMGNGNLIFDSSEFVMSSLFRFDGAESGEVLLHRDSLGVFACEAC